MALTVVTVESICCATRDVEDSRAIDRFRLTPILTPSPVAESAADGDENGGYCAGEVGESGRVCVWYASQEPVTKLSRVRPAETTVAPLLVGGGEHAEEPCRSPAPLAGLPYVVARSEGSGLCKSSMRVAAG